MTLTLNDLHKAFKIKREEEKPEPPCKGLIFRYHRDCWIGSNNDVNFRDRFRFLKSHSCPGCSKCGWLWDDMHERLCDTYQQDTVHFDNPVDGQLYELKVWNVSTDPWTGVVDDWDIGFEKVKHEQN